MGTWKSKVVSITVLWFWMAGRSCRKGMVVTVFFPDHHAWNPTRAARLPRRRVSLPSGYGPIARGKSSY